MNGQMNYESNISRKSHKSSQEQTSVGTRISSLILADKHIAIAVAIQEEDVRHVKALIIGPHATPYEYGFFEFAINFGIDYPSKPPRVDAKTTNGGRTRFNPNIYAGGKVCLSILGTWHGERPGEEWSSAQGLESILWSIQSLMSSNPYENEPGYENAKSKEDNKMNDLYCAKVCALTPALKSADCVDTPRNITDRSHSEIGGSFEYSTGWFCAKTSRWSKMVI
jgi:ubiquitin-protein ligase